MTFPGVWAPVCYSFRAAKCKRAKKTSRVFPSDRVAASGALIVFPTLINLEPRIPGCRALYELV